MSPGRWQHFTPCEPSTAVVVPRRERLCETEGSQSTKPGSAQSFGATEGKSALFRIQPPHRDRLTAEDVQILEMVMLILNAQLN